MRCKKGFIVMDNNILYITYVDYQENAFPGVQAKIAGQIKVFQEAGFCVDRVNQYGNAAQLIDGTSLITERYQAGYSHRFSLFKAVQAAVRKKSYQGAYIRFQFFSEDVRQICSLLKRCGVKVLMEFPTYPYEAELHQQGAKGEVKLLCDRLYRYPCAKYIDAFVTQAEDEAIYGVPCIHVLNGLDYATHPLRNIRPVIPGEIHMAAVASMLPWHGYDRLLRGMAEYYRESSDSCVNFVLHLVGSGKEISRYEEIVKEAQIGRHVVFHGMQGGNSLEQIVSGCDIAIGSLAAFRIGLKKMSTLKSREYCAWGFPSVNATPTDILRSDDPYCLFVPEDESPVNMHAVEAFFHRVYFESGLDAQQIALEIRSAAERCSDVHAVFKPVIDRIQRGDIQ